MNATLLRVSRTFSMTDEQFMIYMQSVDARFEKLLDTIKENGVVKAEKPCLYTLYSWLDIWLNTYKKPNVKPNTFSTLEVGFRVHIKGNLIDMPLNQYDGITLQNFLMNIPASRTRKLVYNLLNASFKDAVLSKIISDNPMLTVKIPAHKKKQGNALSASEEKAFMKAIKGHRLENYFLFLLYTGCRRNEGLSLNAKDIDYENECIHIHGTKTENAERTIPLFKKVRELLSTIEPDSKGYYFRFRPDYPTHAMHKLCPNHKLHDLRHTFATKCLEANIPLKIVQKWLGHSEIDTTANIYVHVRDEYGKQEAKLFDKYVASENT